MCTVVINMVEVESDAMLVNNDIICRYAAQAIHVVLTSMVDMLSVMLHTMLKTE